MLEPVGNARVQVTLRVVQVLLPITKEVKSYFMSHFLNPVLDPVEVETANRATVGQSLVVAKRHSLSWAYLFPTLLLIRLRGCWLYVPLRFIGNSGRVLLSNTMT